MTAVAERTEALIKEPGVYEISEETYFGSQHALSCSGAKLLLPPSCPAKFFWQQDHPVYKDVWDFGSAAHKLVLGSGPELAIIPFDDWRTKDARAQRDEARSAGKIPVLKRDHEVTLAMADAIRRHPMASALLNPEYGHAEQSLFWTDPDSGALLRARLDVLRDKVPGRLYLPDYKTSDSADPDQFARSAASYGYAQQDAWYTDGAAALGYEDPAFLFVIQEKEPPYLVSTVELDDESRRAGRARNRRAIGIYQSCIKSGRWPGYVADDDLEVIRLPYWYLRASEGDR